MDDLNVDCEQVGKRTHMFWEDVVDKSIDYLWLSRPFAKKIYVISHTSRGYGAQFLLRRFLEIRWVPELIMDSTKNLSMSMENLHFLDSLNFMPMRFGSLPESFDLTCKKGCYFHFFNTANNLDYVKPYLNPSTMGQTFVR